MIYQEDLFKNVNSLNDLKRLYGKTKNLYRYLLRFSQNIILKYLVKTLLQLLLDKYFIKFLFYQHF